jgi:BlaI family transcriptional regulator, penicillinase repressor
MPAQRPSDLEMQVLLVLWEQGPATVRRILDLLPDGKTRAYTTVLTVMQGMDRKGLVTRTKEGTAHLFHPAVERDEVVQPVMRTMLRNLFGGDPSKAVQALLDSSDVSAETLQQVRRVIDEAVRSQKEKES